MLEYTKAKNIKVFKMKEPNNTTPLQRGSGNSTIKHILRNPPGTWVPKL